MADRLLLSIFGTFPAFLGGMEAGFQVGNAMIGAIDPTTPASFALLALPFAFIPGIAGIILSMRLLTKYQEDPLKVIGSQLLLGVSLAIMTKFIDAGAANERSLAKLADFVSQSISSQSQSLGTGGPSQNISAVI